MSNTTNENAAEVDTLDRTSKGIIHLSLQGKGGVGKSLVASIVVWWTPFSGHENGPLLDRGRH